jgi:hypothetical protein
MIATILVGLACLAAGVIAGAIGHAVLKKEAAATAVELTDWAQKLRNAASTDVQDAKARIRLLVDEIEKKI